MYNIKAMRLNINIYESGWKVDSFILSRVLLPEWVDKLLLR